ncbi:MAG: exodeoxyribonuclease VII large subunit, partial [Rhodobacteraceae bacterium]|nr:exodeoxyribonuclease VII large subunit [Paracoccaceae bacterium]
QAGRGRFEILARTLASLGPEAVLARGFAIVRDGAGAVLPRADRARAATSLEIEFADGRLTATPADAPPPSEPPAAPNPKPRRPRKPKPPEQGSLF